MTVIAHRGFGGLYPENTVDAVERATVGSDAADAVEIDVMPTADGRVVAFHDETPARVTGVPGDLADRPIWETPYDTLRDLDVLGTGRGIPTLPAVLDAVPTDVPVNIEFKNPGSADVRFAECLGERALERARERWSPFAERVLDAVDVTGHDVLVSSFCEGAIAAIKAVDPSVPVASVVWDSLADGLAIARRHDCEALHVPRTAVQGTSFYGADYHVEGWREGVDVVAAARGEGRAVHAWTVTNWRQAAELADAGVDAIIADYPGLLRYDPGRSGVNVAGSDD
ncbi:glycerophosphodiester phosphodiesterase [Halorarum halophilum]|uniref:Glycerophosphodiester phosphodiesterase n=1 Tax=Halorarum halophilum TaxID=2743090 RepID=A0A7D5KX31_9EURY|nr:glycerophosphodiester phosphodiesterase [Halobaculum halophilum]QLG27618.1 glycerophosphodiester phosphodiesterase [Halobaculum halophilum]